MTAANPKALACVASMRGWFSIVDADTYRGISWASVEGPESDMLELADALEAWKPYRAKRCAVEIDGDRFWLSSPRNSTDRGVPFARSFAGPLVESIRAEVSADSSRPPESDDGDES